MEGNDLGYDHAPGHYYYYGLFDYFGCQYLEDGNPSSTGNVTALHGVPGGVTDGFTFGYPYRTAPDHYPSVVASAARGPLLLHDQSSQGRVVCHTGAGYRTIASFVVFGALEDQQTSTKQELMGRYVEFLVGTPAEDPPQRVEPVLRLGAPYPNPFSREVTLTYSLAHAIRAVARVADLSGRTVADLGALGNPRGTLLWNGTDRHGRPAPPGVYVVTVEPYEGARRVLLLR